MSSSSSQADSAGSIPVTRSTREKRCNKIELEDSGPPACSVMFSGCAFSGSSNLTQVGSPRNYELDVNGLNYNSTKKCDQ
jgi:hypothetical protein